MRLFLKMHEKLFSPRDLLKSTVNFSPRKGSMVAFRPLFHHKIHQTQFTWHRITNFRPIGPVIGIKQGGAIRPPPHHHRRRVLHAHWGRVKVKIKGNLLWHLNHHRSKRLLKCLHHFSIVSSFIWLLYVCGYQIILIVLKQ